MKMSPLNVVGALLGMTVGDQNPREMLKSARDLIEIQNKELSVLRDAVAEMSAFADAQAVAAQEAEDRAEELEKLLQQSDEGLSEALIVLSAMREGLKKINAAANATISKFSDIGYSSDVTKDVADLSNALSETDDNELLTEHEAYLKALRERIGMNRG